MNLETSSSLQQAKAVVRELSDTLDAARPEGARDALTPYVASDWLWRGMHPFDERRGAAAVADIFWKPLKHALRPLQRRRDIFIAGFNAINDRESLWVIEMGHLMGLFDEPWLGIRPTRRIAMLRYCEFHRVMEGQIAETAHFCDIPHLMMQAGQNPFPPETGITLVQPGPRTHDGLCFQAQDTAVSNATLAAIDDMLADMAPEARAKSPDAASHLRRTWHEDMLWWGPAGIGATYTIERYLKQHSTPFANALTKGYRFNGHIAKLAEGSFGGFFGWPNLTVANAGGYMGMPAGAGPADMRVVDLYRVKGGKIAENWIFIDLLHFLAMQGLDVLERMDAVQKGGG
ncbi:MAG: ester cyclase [Erythrobacter sp.]